MRWFVWCGIKGGGWVALNQWYKSEISDEVFVIIWSEIIVKGNNCEIVEKCFEFFEWA